MRYDEAYNLKPGDKVTVISTNEGRSVESVEGTLSHIFILLDDGQEYNQREVEKSSCPNVLQTHTLADRYTQGLIIS